MEITFESDRWDQPIADKAEQPTQSNWLLMLAIGFLVGLDFLQSSMVVLSSAHIRGGVDASPEEFVWTTAAYAATVVLVNLNMQRLVGWLGYRHYLTLSLLVDALGSYLCATSHDVSMLIFGRVVQALGVAALFTGGRILLEISFAGSDYHRALRYFGYVPILFMSAAPLLGSFVLDNAEWNIIFLLPIPLLLACAALVYFVVPGREQGDERARENAEEERERRTKYDYWPVAVFSFAMVAIQTVMMRVQFQFISQSPALLLLLAIALVALSVFVYHQWQSGQPILHLRGLHLSLAFRWGLVFYAIYYLLSYSFSYMFPLYCEQALGFSAQLTGRLLFLSNAMSLVSVFFMLNFGRHILNRKWVMCPALLFAAGASWWIAHLAPGISPEKLYGPLVLHGLFGMLLILPVAGMTFQEFDHNFFAHAYRLKNIVRQLCNTSAVAAMTSLLQHRQVMHRATLDINLSQHNDIFVQRANTLASVLTGRGLSATDAKTASLALLNRMAEQQTLLLSCLDTFSIIAGLATVSCALLLLQNRLK